MIRLRSLPFATSLHINEYQEELRSTTIMK